MFPRGNFGGKKVNPNLEDRHTCWQRSSFSTEERQVHRVQGRFLPVQSPHLDHLHQTLDYNLAVCKKKKSSIGHQTD